MNIIKVGTVLVTGAISLIGLQSPVAAASVATNAFLTNLIPNIDFLDRSSRVALDNSKAARLRDFARNQARDQTMAANAVDDWVEADKGLTVASADPAPGPLLTGRSVAVDGQQAASVVDKRLPLGQEDIDFIEGLNGPEFDTSYKAKQLDALNQVASDYQIYLAQGDDPALLALAKHELPKVKAQIVELGKI